MRAIPSTQRTKQRVTSPPAITRPPLPPVGSVSVPEFFGAVESLLRLCGLDPYSVLRGFSMSDDGIIEFRSAVPVEGVDPAPSGDDLGAIWCWPVRVQVRYP